MNWIKKNNSAPKQQGAKIGWKDQPEFFGVWAGLAVVVVCYAAVQFGWLFPRTFQLPLIGGIASHTVRCQPIVMQAELRMVVQIAILAGWAAVAYSIVYWLRSAQAVTQTKNQIISHIKKNWPEKSKAQLWKKYVFVLALVCSTYVISIGNPWCETDKLVKFPIWLIGLSAAVLPTFVAALLFSLRVIGRHMEGQQQTCSTGVLKD